MASSVLESQVLSEIMFIRFTLAPSHYAWLYRSCVPDMCSLALGYAVQVWIQNDTAVNGPLLSTDGWAIFHHACRKRRLSHYLSKYWPGGPFMLWRRNGNVMTDVGAGWRARWSQLRRGGKRGVVGPTVLRITKMFRDVAN